MGFKATTLIALAVTAFFILLPFSACGLVTTRPAVTTLSDVGSDKVDVSFYYEALCSSCRDFIRFNLGNLYPQLSSIVNLRLIPWGNARIVNGNFVCQYGPDECYLNAVHACAIHKWPDVKTHLDFIHCSSNSIRDWAACVSNETAQELQQCATSNLGKNLQLAFAYETQNLNPPLEFVPWGTVNNVPLKKNLFDIAQYICDAYTGTDLPEACNKWTNRNGQGEYGTNKSELKTYKRG